MTPQMKVVFFVSGTLSFAESFASGIIVRVFRLKKTTEYILTVMQSRVIVTERSGPRNTHFYDLKMTPNIMKDVNMKK